MHIFSASIFFLKRQTGNAHWLLCQFFLFCLPTIAWSNTFFSAHDWSVTKNTSSLPRIALSLRISVYRGLQSRRILLFAQDCSVTKNTSTQDCSAMNNFWGLQSRRILRLPRIALSWRISLPRIDLPWRISVYPELLCHQEFLFAQDYNHEEYFCLPELLCHEEYLSTQDCSVMKLCLSNNNNNSSNNTETRMTASILKQDPNT